MLFNPEFTEIQPIRTNPSDAAKPSLNDSYKMFSAASPSPTRTMIKEANDHLQLLHQRVMELEKTVQEQAEALIKKDEYMQIKLRELSDAKDAQIAELRRAVEAYEQRAKKLEQQCHDKESQLELMLQKCECVDELDVYIPALEKLVASLKKLPTTTASKHAIATNHGLPVTVNSIGYPSGHHIAKGSSSGSGTRTRKVSRGSGIKTPDRHRDYYCNSLTDAAYHVDGTNDRLVAGPPAPSINSSGGQTLAELRIGRSFNINSNFSMSEDEDEMDKFS